jgi:hypothetical protein
VFHLNDVDLDEQEHVCYTGFSLSHINPPLHMNTVDQFNLATGKFGEFVILDILATGKIGKFWSPKKWIFQFVF